MDIAIGTVKPDAQHKHTLVWLACQRCGQPRWVRLEGGKPKAEICAECLAHFTALVCAHCRKRWRGASTPSYCPDCGVVSYPIVLPVPYEKGWYD